MRLTTVIRWAVIGGALLECLAFGAFGGYELWWGIANSDRVEGLADLVSNVISVGILALAAGFGLGAFLLSFRYIGLRIAGAAFHLVATALAASALVWLGVQEVGHSDDWSPGIAFVVAAAVIAIGLAVLVSLFLRVQRQGKSPAAAG